MEAGFAKRSGDALDEQHIMEMIRHQRSLRAVELSSVAGSSSRQFDRSASFSAQTSNWDDDSSDSAESQQGASPSSWATGAFEPFEVEEQATEVKYLKTAYDKKVVAALDWHRGHKRTCLLPRQWRQARQKQQSVYAQNCALY